MVHRHLLLEIQGNINRGFNKDFCHSQNIKHRKKKHGDLHTKFLIYFFLKEEVVNLKITKDQGHLLRSKTIKSVTLGLVYLLKSKFVLLKVHSFFWKDKAEQKSKQ